MDEASRMRTDHATHGYIGDKGEYLRRLKRIEGQARGGEEAEQKLKEASAAIARLVRS